MSRKGYTILGVALLAVFAAFALASFRQNLTPYVSFAEARSTTRLVQVAGGLEKGSSAYDDPTASLAFTLKDNASAATLRVRYKGLKPANFEDAISIVAIGRWDPRAQELRAEKLLVKCPSKYQGIESPAQGATVEKTYG